MKRVFKVVGNIGLVFLSVMLMIGFLEWMLRVTNIQRVVPLNPPIYQTSSNDILSYEHIPSIREKAYGSTVTTNDQGFRSSPLATDKPVLAVIGDSVAFGLGVNDDETIPYTMQELLPEYHVVNAGINGYNIWQEAEQYRTTIAPMKPAMTVLMFNFNDMDETFRLDSEGYFVPRSYTGSLRYTERLDALLHQPGTLPIPFKSFLQRNSALFNLLVRATRSIRSHPDAHSIFEETITNAQLQQYADELAKLSQMLGDQPRLYIIWPEADLHVEARAFITQVAEQQGFTVLDFYEIYGNTYPSLGWDGHPNAATNRKSAQLIVDAMRAWNLIPSK